MPLVRIDLIQGRPSDYRKTGRSEMVKPNMQPHLSELQEYPRLEYSRVLHSEHYENVAVEFH
jgi:hypothetical protein